MNVLFCVRHNFYESHGGAQVQILKTVEYLKKLGVDCEITNTPLGIEFSKYDIVHLSDLTWVYDNLTYLKEMNIQKFKGIRILSTIYWPFDEYASFGAPLIQKIIFKLFGINGFEFAKAFAKFVTSREKVYLNGVKNGFIQNQVSIVKQMDWLLPNSIVEMEALNKRLCLNNTNFSIVNNAIDTTIFDQIIERNEINKIENLITFVARIDARKNQLGFLKAMMNTDFPIRFIGNAGPNSNSYFLKLKELAIKRGNVEFISHIPQEEVFKHMLESKVNVLTSWIETPGLVSLEAAYAGCNIVVSDKGSVRDYFKDFAFYCDPQDTTMIYNQVINALSTDFDPAFKILIKGQYTWERTAIQTHAVYKKFL